MRAIRPLVLALPLLPSLAMAQPEPGANAPEDCAALVAAVPDILTNPETVIQDVEGGCHATHISYAVGSLVKYTADEVTLLSPDLFENFASETVFPAVDLTISNARLQLQTASPLQNYISSLSAVSMSFRVVYTTDPEARTAEAIFGFEAPRLGSLELTASLADFDNADFEVGNSDTFAGTIKRLGVTLDDTGLFATIFAPPILSTLDPDTDPRPMIATMQETIIGAVSGLPGTVITAESSQVLAALVRALPKPEGRWSVIVESETGIEFEDVLGGNPVALLAALTDAKIEATGAPSQATD